MMITIGNIEFSKEELTEGLWGRVESLGLDLDRVSKYGLLLTYFKCRMAFPGTTIEVEVSASGKGYHIIVNREMSVLENILWRASLLDDDKRLIYSLRKFMADPKFPFFDLLFTEKGGQSVQKIDMNSVLKPHIDELKVIAEKWGTEEGLQRIGELSKKLPDLNTKGTWTTAFNIGPEVKEAGQTVLENIAMKDMSFEWNMFPDYFGKGYTVIVYSPDKDTAQRRGLWLVKKVVEFEGCKYWVRKI